MADLTLNDVLFLRNNPETASPSNQATTNSYADVTDSLIDALYLTTVSYTIKNVHESNSIDWKVLGGNQSDLSDAVTVQGEATVAASASGSYSTTTAVWRYYKVQVKATSGGNQGTAQVRGVAK